MKNDSKKSAKKGERKHEKSSTAVSGFVKENEKQTSDEDGNGKFSLCKRLPFFSEFPQRKNAFINLLCVFLELYKSLGENPILEFSLNRAFKCISNRLLTIFPRNH